MIIPESESSRGHGQEHCHSYISFFRIRSLPGSMCTTFFEDEFEFKPLDVMHVSLGGLFCIPFAGWIG